MNPPPPKKIKFNGIQFTILCHGLQITFFHTQSARVSSNAVSLQMTLYQLSNSDLQKSILPYIPREINTEVVTITRKNTKITFQTTMRKLFSQNSIKDPIEN